MVKLKLTLWRESREKVPVALGKLLVEKQFADVIPVPGYLVVVVLHPCEERRVVRMLDAQGRAAVFKHSVIEVVERLDAWEKFRGILAEHHHELRVPDPDGVVPEPLVHIERLHEPLLPFHVSISLLPGLPVEFHIARLGIEHRLRDERTVKRGLQRLRCIAHSIHPVGTVVNQELFEVGVVVLLHIHRHVALPLRGSTRKGMRGVAREEALPRALFPERHINCVLHALGKLVPAESDVSAP